MARGCSRGLILWCWVAPWTVACGGQEVNLGKAPARTTVAATQPPAPAPPDAGPAAPSTGSAPTSGAEDAAAPSPATPAEPDAAPALPVLAFGEPELVTVLNSDVKDDNPTLTGDELEIYFSSKRGGDEDVWFAQRSSVGDAFSEPVRLDAVSTEQFDSSPAIEPEGLVLWVGSRKSEDELGVDIFRSTRSDRGAAWSAPVPVDELNSAQDDIPRPTGAFGTVMPLASRRGGDLYQTYLAVRPAVTEPFAAPTLLMELARSDANTVDAFLTEDGLTLFYVHATDGLGDLFASRRRALDQPFQPGEPLDGLNTEADERDPWLSSDGSTLYFASDRDGDLDIYLTRRSTL